MIWYEEIESPIGRILAAVSEHGLRVMHFPHRGSAAAYLATLIEDERSERSPQKLADVRRQLDEYFAGARTSFDLPLDLRGTDFQRRVWKALRTIPYGATASYGDIARRVGRPGGARAVGQANNRNPVGLVVPCHRVVASNGIGGYGSGLAIKEKLLELEKSRVSAS